MMNENDVYVQEELMVQEQQLDYELGLSYVDDKEVKRIKNRIKVLRAQLETTPA